MILSTSDLKKRLGNRQVLSGIALTCEDAEAIVVLGQNGSGKSTLLRLIAGIIEPDEGKILVADHEMDDGGIAARRQLGYVPDNTDPLPELLVAELCALVCSLKQAPPPPRALVEELGVQPFFHQRLSTLSFGQRKRACLLAALIGEPPLLILDEPTNGLDPDGVALVSRLVTARCSAGTATLIATNDLPFADALDCRQFHLRDGQLVPRQRAPVS